MVGDSHSIWDRRLNYVLVAATGMLAGALVMSWHYQSRAPRSVEECILAESKGRTNAVLGIVRKVCAQRFSDDRDDESDEDPYARSDDGPYSFKQ